MDPALFDDVRWQLAAFHRRFAPLFGRPEARRRGEQYLRGLVVQQTDRRNAENLAEAIPGATPRALQRFLTEAPWDAEAVIAELQAYLAERLTAPDAVFVLDETGFPKQGTKSVGVARQYCGTLGKVGNCQVGVFLAYASLLGDRPGRPPALSARALDRGPRPLRRRRGAGRRGLRNQGRPGAGDAAPGAERGAWSGAG